MAPMKVPSRFMPVASRRPNAWGAWLALAAMGALTLVGLGVVGVAHPLATGAVLAALVMAAVVSTRAERRRLQALAASRRGESIGEFARSFDARAVDTWVIRAVYEEIQALLRASHAAFPLRASDQLKDLGIDPDDLDMDLAVVIAQRTGRSLDHAAQNPYFGAVKTVADLVMFFNAQSRVGMGDHDGRRPDPLAQRVARHGRDRGHRRPHGL